MKLTHLLQLILILPFVFLSCSSNIEEIENRILSGDLDAFSELGECECGDLSLNPDNLLALSDDTPFSGTCFRYYPQTTIRMEEYQIVRGNYHGYKSIFDMEGNFLTRTLFKFGKQLSAKSEDAITCACKDLTDFKDTLSGMDYKVYNDMYFTGVCENYYSDSSIALKAEYIEGLLHGELTVFNPVGEIVLKEKYDTGKLIE